jgi:hypothetical protein
MYLLVSILLGLLFCSQMAKAFVPYNGLTRALSVRRLQSNPLLAKKGKGFERKVEAPTPEPSESSAVEVDAAASAVQQAELDKKPAVKNEDELFKKYGISDGENVPRSKKAVKKERSDDAPFGEEVLAGIPFSLQQKIDNILVTSTLLALSFVIISGVGMSAGALKVVFPDIQVPEAVDGLITNFLTPAFTPGIGIFFFFSITFGLFKFAQISSSQTVYREP